MGKQLHAPRSPEDIELNTNQISIYLNLFRSIQTSEKGSRPLMWCNLRYWSKHIEITTMRYQSRYRVLYRVIMIAGMPILSSSNSLTASGNPWLNIIPTILMSWTKPSWQSTLGSVGPDLMDIIGEESVPKIAISLLIRLIPGLLRAQSATDRLANWGLRGQKLICSEDGSN